jgi:hypothetical protein
VSSAGPPTAQLVRVGDASRFGITIEPEGGSPRPTLTNVLSMVDLA